MMNLAQDVSLQSDTYPVVCLTPEREFYPADPFQMRAHSLWVSRKNMHSVP